MGGLARKVVKSVDDPSECPVLMRTQNRLLDFRRPEPETTTRYPSSLRGRIVLPAIKQNTKKQGHPSLRPPSPRLVDRPGESSVDSTSIVRCNSQNNRAETSSLSGMDDVRPRRDDGTDLQRTSHHKATIRTNNSDDRQSPPRQHQSCRSTLDRVIRVRQIKATPFKRLSTTLDQSMTQEMLQFE